MQHETNMRNITHVLFGKSQEKKIFRGREWNLVEEDVKS
jgi:hypothetical protein